MGDPPIQIVILEDNAGRVDAMLALLREHLPAYAPVVFNSASQLNAYLEEHGHEVAVLSLDHDLELIIEDAGIARDMGTGREVADFISQFEPSFPVILHSSNGDAVAGMQAVLSDAGWKPRRVIPYGDIEWIAAEWLPAIERSINRSITSDA